MIFLTIIVFIVIFSVLILIHEFGHFSAAKKAGVKVEEFGFGLPPRIWGKKKGETLYSINWIPFGGFVRMLGEEEDTAGRSKRSFANQPLRKQAWIVIAGVVMNLLLAFVLLTIGFWIGIEPLMTDQNDFMAEIERGNVVVEPGIVVVASEVDSFEVGDRILNMGAGKVIGSIEDWMSFLENLDGQVLLDVEKLNGRVESVYLSSDDLDSLMFSPMYIERFVYLDDDASILDPYLDEGDVVIEVNDKLILSEQSLYDAINGFDKIDILVYRTGVGMFEVNNVQLPVQRPLVGYVDPGSPAEEAGIQLGDVVMYVEGQEVFSASRVTEITDELEGDSIQYKLLRGEQIINLDIPLRDGRIGVGVSDLLPYYGNLSLYSSFVPHSLIEVKKVNYGLSAPVVALGEMWRLGKITAVMFVNVLGRFLSGEAVPAGVAGPVGIAQMTYVTLAGGFAAMIRFVALLSLSLGVINILPIPALDGGRLFFILYQAISGRKPNPKVERIIHTGGFFLLLLFIVYITFNDVLNFF